jgi:hypothetical protein
MKTTISSQQQFSESPAQVAFKVIVPILIGAMALIACLSIAADF